jgi:CRP-like cAMP-binding protein
LLRVKRDELIDVVLRSPHIALGLLKVFIRRLRSANETIEKLSVRNGSDA